jgi:YYY domain-containing protein
MLDFILWYVSISLLGWLVFPLAFSLFPGLADRGYALSRTLGLLFVGYLFWLLTSLGWLFNNRGGILLVCGLVLLLSLLRLRSNVREIGLWLSRNRGLILAVELVFLAAFLLMALIRAANPEIVATEKPMELAFINAILQSPRFPPLDPWLSGYAISYYYFGYILVGMLTQLVGTVPGVGFNLGIALVFALGSVGAYGLVVNLLAGFRPGIRQLSAALYGLLGPVFVFLVSNLGGLLEVLHARGIFWSQDANGQSISAFWSWLGINNLSEPPGLPLSWVPGRYLWWWQSSRVLSDLKLNGEFIEIIDEFPFFSFLLADLHPHVLAIPFAFLAMGLALNVLLGNGGYTRIARWRLDIPIDQLLLAMLTLGGLAFLNIWDFPIYTALFAGAYSLRKVSIQGWSWGRLWEFLGSGLLLGLGGFVLFLPWFVGFQSQAGGILPNVIFPTRGAHLWIMFATLWLPISAYLIWLRSNWEARPQIVKGLLYTLAAAVGLWVLVLLLAFAITLLPGLGGLYLGSLNAGSWSELFRGSLIRRALQPGGWITLVVLVGACVGFFRVLKPSGETDGEPAKTSGWSDKLNVQVFSLLLITVGLLLVALPEFIYLRDLFNNRMNTIFKFYYQAWLMWGVAAAFGTGVLLASLRGAWAWIFRAGLALVLIAGLIYPVLGLTTKTNGLRPAAGLTLDGTAYLQRQSPDEYAAMNWLRTQPTATLVEAVGGSYSAFARIATHTGFPSVLGWTFHQMQWRGSASEMGSREADIERLYCTPTWEEAEAIIRQYNIRYVIVGQLEYSQYTAQRAGCPEGLQERKFERNLHLAFENDSVRIYRVP